MRSAKCSRAKREREREREEESVREGERASMCESEGEASIINIYIHNKENQSRRMDNK